MKRARTTTEAAEFGQELLAVKQQLGHGHFLNYLMESGIGEDTARRWMRIAQQVEDIPELLELRLSMAYRVVTTSGEHRAITDSIIADGGNRTSKKPSSGSCALRIFRRSAKFPVLLARLTS
jgi:hypothetical protein